MSDSDFIHENLRLSSLGPDLDKKNLTGLSEIVQIKNFPSHTVLFSEGTAASELSLVCSGKIGIDMRVPLRGSVRILTLGAGDVLGWSSIVGDGIMSASATVLEEVTLLSIPADALHKYCEHNKELGYVIMKRVARALAKRLRGTRLQLLDLFSETEPVNKPLIGRSSQ